MKVSGQIIRLFKTSHFQTKVVKYKNVQIFIYYYCIRKPVHTILFKVIQSFS